MSPTPPAAPGLYAIYGEDQGWQDLLLEPSSDAPLYVGKAEKSLAFRDLAAHFLTNPRSAPRAGGSTVRRSFAALLRQTLDLHAVPRSLARPERFANDALDDGDKVMRRRDFSTYWPSATDPRFRMVSISRHRFEAHA
ncbi:GIY-YIG nuclease family protein [Microbacterium paraoxydans]|uniref:GIY-YIG nuclease family protein n=1 Tax=Microbacterium paraoxydans TaxID=199592 RepID=UPI003D742C9A